MSSFNSIIDYIHHRLRSSIDHVILFMDTQINRWPHNKVHMSLSQGRRFHSNINRGVNGCHCHASLCFIDGLKYSISHDDQSKMYILDHVYPGIFTSFCDHTYSLTHKDTLTHFKAQWHGDHTLSLMIFDVKGIMHFGNIGNVDLDHQIGYIAMTWYWALTLASRTSTSRYNC